MILSAIVAKAKYQVIGRNNTMPWKLRGDLQYFKKTTIGHTVIMGMNTFKSLGMMPLVGRTNIVMTRDAKAISTDMNSPVVFLNDLRETIDMLSIQCEEVFIIGGGQIYAAALPYLDKLYITDIHADIPIISTKLNEYTFFPIDEHTSRWEEVSRVKNRAGEGDEYDYDFVQYTRAK